MIKRFFKIILFIIAMVLFPFDLLYNIIRWFITGKEFKDPIFYKTLGI